MHYEDHVTLWREVGTVLLLFALGTALILIAPTSRVPYLAGIALFFAGVACLIDLIQAPGERPDQLSIALITAAAILVGGW